MVEDPLAGLPRSVREHIEVISEGVQRGENKRQIRQRLKNDGRKIRDIYLLQGIRFLKGQEVNPPRNPRFVNTSKSPDITRSPLSKGPILRNFSYRVGIRDRKTGNFVGGVQVSSHEKLNKADIIAEAAKSIAASGINVYVDKIPDDFDPERDLVLTEAMLASEALLPEL
jgi:hypothetical protein